MVDKQSKLVDQRGKKSFKHFFVVSQSFKKPKPCPHHSLDLIRILVAGIIGNVWLFAVRPLVSIPGYNGQRSHCV